MFTGIVKALGKVESAKAVKGGRVLRIQCPSSILQKLKAGSSVCVNGVCTTITKKSKNWFEIFLMPTTLKITTLGLLKKMDEINLEPSLRMGDELGGHFVLGHVDGVCKVYKVRKVKSDVVIEFRVPRELTHYIVRKGSVALDGVSLTVVDVDKKHSRFTVGLIPYTIKNTTLGRKKAGDRLNIEIDVLARYIIN